MTDKELEEMEKVEDMVIETETEEEKEETVLILSKPFEIDGEMVRKIEYDFNAVKPIQYINLVTKLGKKEQISVPELNLSVQIGFFSLASGVSVTDIKRLPTTRDFTAACQRTRNFLLGTSDTESEEE